MTPVQRALESFERNLSYSRQLDGIYRALASSTTSALDLSDLLRAQIVLAVSAFDHFVHELTRLGMLDAYQGQRPQTDAFQRFEVSVGAVRQAMQNPAQSGWFEQEIRQRLGWRTFQQADKVADAIRLVSDVKLWNAVARRLRVSAKDVKDQLNLIVDRRNKIAHEADIDPTDLSLKTRWPISESDVKEATAFLERLAKAIHAVVS